MAQPEKKRGGKQIINKTKTKRNNEKIERRQKEINIGEEDKKGREKKDELREIK